MDAPIRGAHLAQRITPLLWFDTEAEAAVRFHVSVFDHARILTVTRYTDVGPRPAGMVMTVEFELDGQRFVALNGGPEFTLDEAVSFVVHSETQADVDRYREQLTDGGQAGSCGWCKDRYGLSWQIVADGFAEIVSDPDPARAQRAMHAMLWMGKLDIDALRQAADAAPPAAEAPL